MTDTSTDARQATLAELAALCDELAALRIRRSEIYGRRLELWIAGQAHDPRISQKTLGEASGVSEAAVFMALRDHRKEVASTA